MNKISHVIDAKLRDKQIVELLTKISNGDVVLYEKLDGQNLMFTVTSDRKLKWARSKRDVSKGGLSFIDVRTRIKNEKFAIVLETALKKLERAFLKNDVAADVRRLFEGGKFFLNCEIIDNRLTNVLHYEVDEIVIHLIGLDGEKRSILKKILDKGPVRVDNIVEVVKEEITKKIFNKLDIKKFGYNLLNNCFNLTKLKKEHSSWEELKYILNNAQLSEENRVIDIIKSNAIELNEIGTQDLVSEGVIFEYEGRVLKLTGAFPCYNKVLGLTKYRKLRDIILVPGSFKPPHKGHFKMIKDFATKCEEVIVIISQKPRFSKDGSLEVGQELSYRLWELYIQQPGMERVKIRAARAFSPVTDTIDIGKMLIAGGHKVRIGVSDKGTDSEKYKNILDIPKEVYYCEDATNAADFREAIRNNETLTPFLPTEMNSYPDFIFRICSGEKLNTQGGPFKLPIYLG